MTTINSITDDQAVIELIAAFDIDEKFGLLTCWTLPWSDHHQVGRVRAELDRIGIRFTL